MIGHLRKIVFLILAPLLFVVLMLPVEIFAEENMSEPLVGQTIVEVPDRGVFYTGMGANEVILNHNQNINIGFDESVDNMNIFGNNIERCSARLALEPWVLPSDITRCFFVNNASYDDLLMTSRTYRSGKTSLEIAALIYDDYISGDVYGLSGSGANFALYGRNLKQNAPDASNETWARSNYILNPAAQSSFKADQAEYVKTRVKNMAGEAQTVDATVLANHQDWYLQGSNIINDTENSQKDMYPEGKTWLVTGCGSPIDTQGSCATLRNNHYTFYGKGTLIFLPRGENRSGALTLERGVEIKACACSPGSSLGIIVGGRDANGQILDNSASLTFSGNNYFQSATMVLGRVKTTDGGNLNALGSFVAQSFDFSQSASHSLVFNYDANLEDNWPPGFRYFKMPYADNTAP